MENPNLQNLNLVNSPIAAGDNYYGIIDNRGNLYIAGLDKIMGTVYNSERLMRVSLESKAVSVTTGNGSLLTPPFMGIVTEDGEVYVWNEENITLTPPMKPHKLDFQLSGKIVKIDRDNVSGIYGIIMDNGLAYLTEPYNLKEPILIPVDSGRKIIDFIIPSQYPGQVRVMCYVLDNYGDVYFFYLSADNKRKRIKLDFPNPIRQLSGSSNVNLALSIKGEVYIWSRDKDVTYDLNEIPIFEFVIDEKWAYLIPKKIYKINLPSARYNKVVSDNGRGFPQETLPARSAGVLSNSKNFDHRQNTTKLYSTTDMELPIFIESVSAGYRNAAAITKNGTVYVWGSNIANSLVDEIEEEKLISSGKIVLRGYNKRIILRPLELKLKSKIKSISLGSTFTIALTEDGVLNYWGYFMMAPEDTI